MVHKKLYLMFKQGFVITMVLSLLLSMVPLNVAMAASTVVIVEENLLQNSSFENAIATGTPTSMVGNWYGYKDPERVQSNTHDGNWAAKMSTSLQALEQDVVGLQAGITYQYSIWVKADNASNGTLHLGVKNHGSSEKRVRANNNNWTEYTIEFTPSTGSARLYAWLETNGAGNNFYVDHASLKIKSNLQQIDVENGTIDVKFKDSYEGIPLANDFNVTYSTSILPGTISPLSITNSTYDDGNNIMTLNFNPIAAQSVEQTVNVYVTYLGQTIELDYLVAASGGEVIEAQIESVSSTNGSITVLLDQAPTVAPVSSDFTVTYSIDGGPFQPLATSGFSYDISIPSVSFQFNRLSSAATEQTVEIKVAYNESEATDNFTIGVNEGVIYYVAANGSDNNNGLSPQTPFKSIDKLNTIVFQPGDHILFKKGDEFKGAFKPQGSGIEGHPIVAASYGDEEEARPILKPSDTNWTAPLMSAEFATTVTVNNLISFYNQSYWEVRDLELSGPTHTVDQNVYRRGINITGEDAGDLNHFYFDNLVIHGFHGPNNNAGKSSGGILMEVQATPNTPASQHIPTSINDIRITNSELYDLGRSGVNFVSVWARRAETTDTKWGPYPSSHAPGRAGYAWKPYEDFYLANNLIYDIDGDGAIIDNTLNAVVENNLVYRAAKNSGYAVGLFNWNSDNTIFQFNEVYDTYSTGDAQGIEIDALNDTTYVQYNYVHDNAGGTFMWCNTPSLYSFNGVFRYNISQNDDTRHGVIHWLPGSFGGEVYNNTVYMKENGYKQFLYGSNNVSDAKFYNNIFYYPGNTPFVPNGFSEHNIDWKNNIFHNFTSKPAHASNLITDPMFADPGNGETGVGQPLDATELLGYALLPGSPAINAGIPIANNGGRDYFGNPVTGIPDIGAYDSGTVSLSVGSALYTVDQINQTITVLNSEVLTVDALLSNLVYDTSLELTVYRGEEELTGNDEFETNDQLNVSFDGEEITYTLIIAEDSNLLRLSSNVYRVDSAEKTIGVPQQQAITVDELLANLTYNSGVNVQLYRGNTELSNSDEVQIGDMLKLFKYNNAAVYVITVLTNPSSNERDIPVNKLSASAGSWEANGGASEGPANLVLDGNTSTIWHSKWASDSRFNLHITLTLSDDTYMVDGLRQLPRSGGGRNGIITQYKIQYSTNGTDFIDIPGAEGEWSTSGWQQVEFAPLAAKAIRLVAVDSISQEASKLFASAAEIRLTGFPKNTGDTTAPSAPTNVTVFDEGITDTSFVVQWTAPADSDVIGYNVYVQDGNSERTIFVNHANTTFASVQNLTPAGSYAVQVTALDSAGNESARSGAVNVTLPDHVRPTAPTNLTASNIESESADLVWEASTDNVGVEGYEVYVNEELYDSVTDTSITLQGLVPNANNVIKVRAFDAYGNKSSFSSIVINTGAGAQLPSGVLSGNTTVQENTSFTVTYGIQHVTDAVYGQDVIFTYDPSKLELVSVTPAHANSMIVDSSETTPGQLRVISAGIGSGVTGQTVILTFTAKAVVGAPGTTISAVNAVIANGDGVETELQDATTNIVITSSVPVNPGDANEDGQYTIGDLAIIAAAYGKKSTDADWAQYEKYDYEVNGEIDIADLVFVARKILSN